MKFERLRGKPAPKRLKMSDSQLVGRYRAAWFPFSWRLMYVIQKEDGRWATAVRWPHRKNELDVALTLHYSEKEARRYALQRLQHYADLGDVVQVVRRKWGEP